MQDFFLNIVYKDQTVRFRVVNPLLPLAQLMSNVRHATNKDGMLFFDFPSIDSTGAPMMPMMRVSDTMMLRIR